ncbi:CatB-related O-acetyltransferase [uncultured Winogradskyella sp.]|uniref:CatB-related O-acetyltransferase n=1 Tax=uncultured Winogradskyella sp. TaxID=395353 RepID=UPI00261B0BC4|nr:CatB-related O-acetyltransferase [uncultured Winogradskyella sp.]
MISKLKNKLFNKVYLLLRFGNFIPMSSKVKINKNSKVYGSRLDGNIDIAEGAMVARCELYGNIEIGRYTSLNGPNTDVVAHGGKVIIGQFCSIARNVSMQVSNHAMARATTYPIFKNIFNEEINDDFISKGDIVIGNDVWIGAHSLILSGVKINDGAVIAANSVVTVDIPAYAIVAGSPAKVIKYRFSPETIDQLSVKKWWDWPLEKIKKERDFFKNSLK